MRKVAIICVLIFIIGCQSKKKATETIVKKPSVEKLALTEVSSLQKNRTYELGKRVLLTCNTSTFKPFTTEEATQEVIKKMTRERISLTCQNILRGFGQFNDMKLIEVYRIDKEKATVFRYQCDYEKKHTIKELRVTINDANKITSITTKDWTNEFK
jgi:hypothetical protein